MWLELAKIFLLEDNAKHWNAWMAQEESYFGAKWDKKARLGQQGFFICNVKAEHKVSWIQCLVLSKPLVLGGQEAE